MSKLAIADPPYLRRAVRWYGGGPGHFDGKGSTDFHPEAAEWDEPERHAQLVRDLCAEYDGWAIAMAPDSLPTYLAVAPADARVMVWDRPNAIPSAARVACNWEPVLVLIPEARRGRNGGVGVSDVLHCGVGSSGFVGSKPPAWTRWVLAVMGYSPGEDELTDLFAGSGAVASAADGMLV